MPDLIDREELLHTLSELAPMCREPQVRMMIAECNCWAGISESVKVIQQMKGSQDDN